MRINCPVSVDSLLATFRARLEMADFANFVNIEPVGDCLFFRVGPSRLRSFRPYGAPGYLLAVSLIDDAEEQTRVLTFLADCAATAMVP